MWQTIRDQLEGRVTKADAIRLASSLVLALLLWGWVTTSQDPERTKVFPDIQITAQDLPGDLQVIGSLPTATVTLTGPESVINDITSSQISAHLEIDDVKGPATYPARVVVSAPEGVWDHDVDPSRISVEVEQTRVDQFQLEWQQQGDRDGPTRIEDVAMDVSEVTVRGPASDVDRVARVILPIDLDEQTRNFTAEFQPTAVDADGQPIPEVEVEPARVEADVRVSSRGKSVAVIAQLVGEPAQGYEVVDRQVIPNTILVDGPQDQLDELVAIQTEPVDIAGVTNTVSRPARLVGVPEGIRVLDPADGTVDVLVQVRQRGIRQQLPGQRVAVINLAPGLTAEVNPPELEINVVAPEDTLSELPGSDAVQVQVDAAGLGSGTYSLRPNVVLPPNVQWLSTEPEVVTVTISVTAPSTPVASPSPSASPRASPVSSQLGLIKP